MTDTSTTTPTAPAAQQLNTYYLSDNEHDFEPVLVPFTLTENKFPFVVTAPDASLKQPKYDWGKSVWVETQPDQQVTQIAELQKQVADLTTQLSSAQSDNSQLQQSIASLTQQLIALQEAK